MRLRVVASFQNVVLKKITRSVGRDGTIFKTLLWKLRGVMDAVQNLASTSFRIAHGLCFYFWIFPFPAIDMTFVMELAGVLRVAVIAHLKQICVFNVHYLIEVFFGAN